MTMSGGFGVGGPANAFRFSQTRGRIQGSPVQGVNYPSPFFDVAHTYLPVTVKQMFRWCRYYFLTNPLINAVVGKMSEYPITELVIDHDDPTTVSKWMEFLQDHLQYRSFQVEVGLDYFAYGNAFISIGYAFKKYLQCPTCSWKEFAERCRNHWVFTNYSFRLACPACHTTGDALVTDLYLKNPSGVKLIRWNAEDMEILYNDLTGDYTYFYTIPAAIRNDVIIGRKEVVEKIPQIFVQALKEQKGLVLSKDKLFHLRRPTLAGQDRGWGIPLLLPVLKDTYYLQLMKKAQEAILLEHIVPLRVLFPQPAAGTADPFTSINLVDWRDHVAAEIARWRYDQNYIPIMPLPLGNQTIGGDGKALMLTPEIQQWSEQIVVGMGVPREFIFGGLSYAGTNVSMRMLENAFIGYAIRHKHLLRFVMQEVANFLDWPMPKGHFKPFKMADDIQRKALMLQYNQLNKLSDTTLLADSDLSQEEENKLMSKETKTRLQATKEQQLAMAEIQGEAQLVMTKYQVKAQQVQQEAMQMGPAPGEPGAPEQAMGAPGGQEATPAGMSAADPAAQQAVQQGVMPVPAPSPDQEFDAAIQSRLGKQQIIQGGGAANADLPSMAMIYAQQIAQLDPAMQQMALQNLQLQSPDMAALVQTYLKQMQKDREKIVGGTNGSVDMRPLPEQRAPRRLTTLV